MTMHVYIYIYIYTTTVCIYTIMYCIYIYMHQYDPICIYIYIPIYTQPNLMREDDCTYMFVDNFLFMAGQLRNVSVMDAVCALHHISVYIYNFI